MLYYTCSKGANKRKKGAIMNTINVTITANVLCDLLNGRLSCDACEALCQYLDDCGVTEPLRLGDIAICFSEVPASWADAYDEENIIAHLKNGNILVAQ